MPAPSAAISAARVPYLRHCEPPYPGAAPPAAAGPSEHPPEQPERHGSLPLLLAPSKAPPLPVPSLPNIQTPSVIRHQARRMPGMISHLPHMMRSRSMRLGVPLDTDDNNINNNMVVTCLHATVRMCCTHSHQRRLPSSAQRPPQSRPPGCGS